MKKQEIHPELQEFKELLMRFNNKKSKGVYELMNHLSNQNGFIKTELNKMHDLVKSGEVYTKDGTEFINGLKKLVLLLEPILGIKIMSINGRDYEKYVNLLVKRINSLPANCNNRVLEQIKSFGQSTGQVTFAFLQAQLDYIESLGSPEDIKDADYDKDLIISDGSKQ